MSTIAAPPPELLHREDWTLLRNPETCAQRAGVPQRKLAAIAIKELVDNGLDSGHRCTLAWTDDGTIIIEDDGPGFDGGPENVAKMFSIRRPLSSTKIVRLFKRGAMGNGIRVAVAAVLVSGGTLAVTTRNQRIQLRPDAETGESIVEDVQDVDFPIGTKIEIKFGDGIPNDLNSSLSLGIRAIAMAGDGPIYKGLTSAHWYSVDAFHEILRASGSTVREVVQQFEGMTSKLDKVCAPYKATKASTLTKAQADALLASMQFESTPVSLKRIERLGASEWLGWGKYAFKQDEFEYGGARLPVKVEAWATIEDHADANDFIHVHINRTPIVSAMSIQRAKHANRNVLFLWGCGLAENEGVVDISVSRCVQVRLNVQTPWIPIVTDGKEPDLALVNDLIVDAIKAAVTKAKAATSTGERKKSRKQFVIDNLDTAVAQTSGNGEIRYSLRQLFYTFRPLGLEEFDDFKWGTFCSIITAIEQNGDIPGLYRDSRGTLYHPHTQSQIPLGTLAVENYRRPEWTFKRVLYCEKEGPLHSLRSVGWPELHDCALLSSKGYAVRAVKDLLDFLGDSDEPLEFYCISDADGEGSLIYQSLCDATAARPGRSVKIINLGLHPQQALDMGLIPEPRQPKKRVPVGRHVREWGDWFQTNRIELNAMTAPQFVRWLTDQLVKHSPHKLIPPEDVVHDRLLSDTRDMVYEFHKDRILEEADIDSIVDEDMERFAKRKSAASVEKKVREALKSNPKQAWWESLKGMGAAFLKKLER